MLTTTLALAAASFISPTSEGPAGLTIDWRGGTVERSALLETLVTDKVTSADFAKQLDMHLERYAAWVSESEYHVALSDDGLALLFTESNKISKRRMKLVEKTLKSFAEHVPAPDRSGSDETFPKSQWGASPFVPDVDPVLLFEIRKEPDYRSLVAAASATGITVEDWSAVMSENPGFVHPELSAAAWQEAPSGFENGAVWRTENELVNRMTRLLMHRSFGPQPVWFSLSTAWLLEQDVLSGIYSFPFRYEFVGIGEHKGWKNELRAMYKKRKGEPLKLGEFADWKLNTWDDDYAAVSWGVTTMLNTRKKGSLGELAEAFRVAFKEASTKSSGGSSSYNPIAQIPLAKQASIVEGLTEADIWETAADYFRTGKLPKPKKKKQK